MTYYIYTITIVAIKKKTKQFAIDNSTPIPGEEGGGGGGGGGKG